MLCYTRRLPARIAYPRRDEHESELWEQPHEGRPHGYSDIVIAASMAPLVAGREVAVRRPLARRDGRRRACHGRAFHSPADRGGPGLRRRAVVWLQWAASPADRTSAVAGDVDLDAVGQQNADGIDGFFENSATQTYDSVRAVLVTVDGQRLVERYHDAAAETTHNVYSVTKSVLSVLVGIALDEGHLTGLEQPLAELLPSYAGAMSSQTEGITLRQLLTMTAGLPEEDAGDDFLATDDWVATIVTAGPTRPPGQEFGYSNAASHLVSAVLAEATGQSVLAYARTKLFDPLGIDSTPAAEPVAREENLALYEAAAFAWPVAPEGYHTGFGWLKITATDMDKIGQLILTNGQWQDRQLVSEDWIQDATAAQVEANGVGEHYGYHWWVTDADGHPAFVASGFGGQLIEVVPALGLVVVVAADAETTRRTDPGALTELVNHVIAPALNIK